MRREALACLFVGLALVMAITYVSRALHEPRYEGHSFDHWFRESRSQDEEKRSKSYTAFGALHERNPRAISTMLMRFEKEENEQCLLSALAALRKIGPANEQVVPAIVSAASRTKSEEAADAAISTLSTMKESAQPALPFLIAQLAIEKRRQPALQALEKLGSDASPALPQLRAWVEKSAATENDLKAGLSAMSSLSGKRLDDEILPGLAAKVLASDDRARHLELARAARAKIRGSERNTAKVFCDHLAPKLEEPKDRRYALDMLKALGSLGSDAAPVVAEFVVSEAKNEKFESVGITEECVKYLLTLRTGQISKAVVPAMVKQLESEVSLKLKRNALWVLYYCEGAALPAVPTLRKIESDSASDKSLVSLVRLVLGRIGREYRI